MASTQFCTPHYSPIENTPDYIPNCQIHLHQLFSSLLYIYHLTMTIHLIHLKFIVLIAVIARQRIKVIISIIFLLQTAHHT